MQIEQLPPNGPNFKLVVFLFGATIVVIFIVALLLLKWDGKHLVPRHVENKAASWLVLPDTSAAQSPEQA